MSAGTRPPLLELGGEEAFKAYEKEFGRLYQNRRVYDILGNMVIFPPSSCWHVCFKRDENDRSAKRPRNIWGQERADRIPWIMSALNDPATEIRPDKTITNRLNYLLIVEADPERNLPQEYYCVVVEKERIGVVAFVTAFPVDQRNWVKRRQSGKALYPINKKDGA